MKRLMEENVKERTEEELFSRKKRARKGIEKRMHRIECFFFS